MLGKKRNIQPCALFCCHINAKNAVLLMIMLSLFSFGMGIEFREGSLLITSKNNHVAKKGEITNKPRHLCISLFNLTKQYIYKQVFFLIHK